MGKKKSQQQLTPLELQIMNVLWDFGPANVQTVQENSRNHKSWPIRPCRRC